MMGGLRFPTVPCSPGGEDGPSIVTLTCVSNISQRGLVTGTPIHTQGARKPSGYRLQNDHLGVLGVWPSDHEDPDPPKKIRDPESSH